MATKTVHSHNYQHFENVQLSSQAFYDELITDIDVYQFPNMTYSKALLKAGDYAWSGKREYLELTYKDLRFYICAAPFGKNFFVSWWLKESSTAFDRFFNRLFGGKEKTFYQIDTEAMFLSSMNAIINRKIEQIKVAHGFRKPESVS